MAKQGSKARTAKASGASRKQFSYTATEGTAIALIFDYLHALLGGGFSYREGKGRAKDALMAFWRPYAAQASKRYTQSEVQAMARSSVDGLIRQIDSICDDFDIDNPLESPVLNSESVAQRLRLEESIQEAIAQKLTALGICAHSQQGPLTNGSGPSSVEQLPLSKDQEELEVRVDDEELLGEYFGKAGTLTRE